MEGVALVDSYDNPRVPHGTISNDNALATLVLTQRQSWGEPHPGAASMCFVCDTKLLTHAAHHSRQADAGVRSTVAAGCARRAGRSVHRRNRRLARRAH